MKTVLVQTANRIRLAAAALAALAFAFSVLLAAVDTRCEPMDHAAVAECGAM